MIACLAAIENQQNLSGLILESAAIEMHPKTASWTVRTAAKILSKEGFLEPFQHKSSWQSVRVGD